MAQLFAGPTNNLVTKKPLPFALPIVFILKTPENANISQPINIVACKPRSKKHATNPRQLDCRVGQAHAQLGIIIEIGLVNNALQVVGFDQAGDDIVDAVASLLDAPKRLDQ